jgi:molybdopterin molybdotransferase
MVCRFDIGLDEALAITLARSKPLAPCEVALAEACGLVAARDELARVDCPTRAASTKDGFAVRSVDLEGAGSGRPVRLRLEGSVAAGGLPEGRIAQGSAARIYTGAPLPEGADAVLPVERVRLEGDEVICPEAIEPGRNVQPRGASLARGARVARAGQPLSPARVGLLAAAGLERVLVHPRPRVAIVATGDEVVLPGSPLSDGQVFASNAYTLAAWLSRFGMQASIRAVGDRPEFIRAALADGLASADALLTSGGAWTSDRDLVAGAVAGLGAELCFHRVRLGPGKAVALGLAGTKPIFCLAGGPASNEMGFLQIALPGLLCLAGRAPRPFPRARARLARAVRGDSDWTQVYHARLERGEDGRLVAVPLGRSGGLETLAAAEALVRVPEGVLELAAGEEAEVELLLPERVREPGDAGAD